MPHSYAQAATLDCPNCGQSFQADIWLTVDTAERPDLTERLRGHAPHRDLPPLRPPGGTGRQPAGRPARGTGAGPPRPGAPAGTGLWAAALSSPPCMAAGSAFCWAGRWTWSPWPWD